MGKKKKEKVVYIDDGRTIADMSGVTGGFQLPERPAWKPRSSLKEQWETYKAAVKMMIVPMLTVVGGMVAVYILLTLIFWLM